MSRWVARPVLSLRAHLVAQSWACSVNGPSWLRREGRVFANGSHGPDAFCITRDLVCGPKAAHGYRDLVAIQEFVHVAFGQGQRNIGTAVQKLSKCDLVEARSPSLKKQDWHLIEPLCG